MNNYLKTTSKTYKICSEYFNKLVWINFFGDLYRLRKLLELKFSDNRIYTDYNGFTTSETFNKDVLEGNYEINI